MSIALNDQEIRNYLYLCNLPEYSMYKGLSPAQYLQDLVNDKLCEANNAYGY